MRDTDEKLPRNEIYLPGLPATPDPSALHLGYWIKDLEINLSWGKWRVQAPSFSEIFQVLIKGMNKQKIFLSPKVEGKKKTQTLRNILFKTNYCRKNKGFYYISSKYSQCLKFRDRTSLLVYLCVCGRCCAFFTFSFFFLLHFFSSTGQGDFLPSYPLGLTKESRHFVTFSTLASRASGHMSRISQSEAPNQEFES